MLQPELQATFNKISVIAFDIFDYLQESNPVVLAAYREESAVKAEILMDYIREMDLQIKMKERN